MANWDSGRSSAEFGAILDLVEEIDLSADDGIIQNATVSYNNDGHITLAGTFIGRYNGRRYTTGAAENMEGAVIYLDNVINTGVTIEQGKWGAFHLNAVEYVNGAKYSRAVSVDGVSNMAYATEADALAAVLGTAPQWGSQEGNLVGKLIMGHLLIQANPVVAGGFWAGGATFEDSDTAQVVIEMYDATTVEKPLAIDPLRSVDSGNKISVQKTLTQNIWQFLVGRMSPFLSQVFTTRLMVTGNYGAISFENTAGTPSVGTIGIDGNVLNLTEDNDSSNYGARIRANLKTGAVGILADSTNGAFASISSVAVLDLQSTVKGFLPPRMTTTQRDAISAVAGLTVYNTTTNKLNFYNGAAWEVVTSA